jgi:hypothetical protein
MGVRSLDMWVSWWTTFAMSIKPLPRKQIDPVEELTNEVMAYGVAASIGLRAR